MNALFIKGNDRQRISTTRTVMIVSFPGSTSLPFRHTVDDPEKAAEERAAYLISRGYTRTDD